MNKSILVLDENSVVHGLISSALDLEGLSLHHEFDPEQFVKRASSLMPDLILMGKSASDPDYALCRSLAQEEKLTSVPVVLLTGSMERLSKADLEGMRVAGVVRKPFEASDLQQQVGKYIDIADLIGTSYEFRQTQAMGEEAANPLANLDVLDDEVLSMLKDGGQGAQLPEAEPGPGAETEPAVSEEVLAETLEPELAFEMVDEKGELPPADPSKLETLETLEGEIPAEVPEPVADEAELEELGAEDLLDEEAPEETILEPAGFDQSLEEGPAAEAADAGGMDEIEVELPESALDMGVIDQELSGGGVDLFETGLEDEPPAPPSPEEFEESIPLSVRHMMDMKPVFTREDEGADPDADVSFTPDAAEVEAIQNELENLDEISLEEEEIEDQDLEFVDLDGEDPALTASPAEQGAEIMDLDAEELAAGEIGEEALEDLDAPVSESQEAPEAGEDEAAETISLEEDIVLEADADGGFAAVDEEEAQEPPPSPETPLAETPSEAAMEGAGQEEEEDYFLEEYLGDEEIDESQIIAAEEISDYPELSPEDEKEMDFLVSEDEQVLSRLDTLDDEVPAADAKDEEEIEVDQEEEDLIRASLEDERISSLPVDEPAGMEGEAEDTSPLFERNFNALDEEQGPVPPPDDELPPIEDLEEEIAMPELDDKSITLEGPIGRGLEEEPVDIETEAASEVDETEALDVPSGFTASPNEEFPPDAVQEPFTGREEEAGDLSPTPRYSPDEVLEDPDTMEPVLPPSDKPDDGDDRESGDAATEDDSSAPDVSIEDMGGELEVPEEALADELGPVAEPVDDELASILDADAHPDASDFIAMEDPPPDEPSQEMAAEDAESPETDSEFNDLFSSLQEEIAANPEGENLDDLLRIEGLRDRVANLDFPLPQNESTFSRAMGIYGQAGEASDSSYPAALWGIEGGTAGPPAPETMGTPEAPGQLAAGIPLDGPGALSLLDPDIRAKLGLVLDEIISVSVRKAVQEEMPKLMERMSKET